MNISRVIAAIALLIVTLAIIAFAILNAGPEIESINLGIGKYYNVPLVVALFAAFVVGVIVTLLYCLYYFIDLGLSVRRLKKKNKQLEKELVAIRNLPLEESLEDTGSV
jgi:uncharacterized integral membrane protein